MQIGTDQQTVSSASTSASSSSLPSETTVVTAAVTLTAAASEPQPVARFVECYISLRLFNKIK